MVDEAIAVHSSLPGGLTQSLLDSLSVDGAANIQLHMARLALCDHLPAGRAECVADALFDTDRQRERAWAITSNAA